MIFDLWRFFKYKRNAIYFYSKWDEAACEASRLADKNAELIAKCAILRDEIKDLKSSNYCLNLLYSKYSETMAKKEGFEIVTELEQKIHILNEANINLENAFGSQADFFQQQISVLESKNDELVTKCNRLEEQLKEANEVITNFPAITMTNTSDAIGYLERWGVK